MQEGKQHRLEEKLKRMIREHDQSEAKKRQVMTQVGTGNIIRRRKGEKDKRFSSKISHMPLESSQTTP